MRAGGRALLLGPQLRMVDEPSLGLAPLVVREFFRTIDALRSQGVPILLIEQNARAALEVADHGYVLETGAFSVQGPAVRMPAQMRDMSQMPQPVKVTPFFSASASISAAASGSLLCGR